MMGKRDRIKHIADKNVLLLDPSNIYYYTGFSGYGIFTVFGRPILHVPGMEYETAKKASSVPVRILDWNKIMLPRTIYVEYSKVNLYVKKRLKGSILRDIDKVIAEQRSIKDSDEIRKMKKIGRLTSMMFSDIIKNIKTFRTEKDIERFIRRWALDHDLNLSFDPIVANNVSEIHYAPKDKRLRKGFLLIDAGLKDEYCSDMTRTFYLGKPSRKEELLYERVLNAYNLTLENIKEGMPFKELDRLSRKDIKYPHAVGHGVGLEVHEPIDIIKRGSVFAVEPGLYGTLDGRDYGIRIEDTILLSSSPVALTEFDRQMKTL